MYFEFFKSHLSWAPTRCQKNCKRILIIFAKKRSTTQVQFESQRVESRIPVCIENIAVGGCSLLVLIFQRARSA